jgi:hypothetical protein
MRNVFLLKRDHSTFVFLLSNGKVSVRCRWHYFWLSITNYYKIHVRSLVEKSSFQT